MAENSTQPDESVELTTDYANNVFLEPSVWDLKLIFGEYTGRTQGVDWHTSVTLPWAQVKLLMYYLGIHVAIQEFNQGGPIPIPSVMLPQELPDLPESEQNQVILQVNAFAKEYRKQFLEKLKNTPSV